jgi:hypothetical protein
VEMLLLLVGGPGSAHSLPSLAQHCKNVKGIILRKRSHYLCYRLLSFNHGSLLPSLLLFLLSAYQG